MRVVIKSRSISFARMASLAARALVVSSLFAASALADDTTSDPAAFAGPDPLIIAFGDSLTAGYGLGPGEAFPDQLQGALAEQGLSRVKVHNAGVSGDTSAGGRSRLVWNLAGLKITPDLVILELGANDALRGLLPERTRANIDAMLAELKKRGIPVLLTGMQAPPNLGKEYGAEFNSLFPDLAEKYDSALYPFFLDGVAADPSLNQPDGIHPTKEGVAIIVEQMLPYVLRALGEKTS